MNERPSYYAVIPADVRYDERLTANAKLLFGEIAALSGKDGRCFASNSYFAKLYRVGTSTVKGWMRSLVACGYIGLEYEYREGTKEIERRFISIKGGSKNCPTWVKNLPTPGSKIWPDNTINDNNMRSQAPPAPKRKQFTPPTVEEVAAYCRERRNTVDPQRFVDYYSATGWTRGKTKIRDWRACVRTWEQNSRQNQKREELMDYV